MARRQIPRAQDRPNAGDARPCPFCRGLMYFEEATSDDTQPAWFCSCGYQIFARQSAKASFKERQRALIERRAKALRKTMAVRARAERLLKASQRLTEARRRGKK